MYLDSIYSKSSSELWLNGNKMDGTDFYVYGDQYMYGALAIGSAGMDLNVLAQEGATDGQVLKWNGTQYAPANDSTGSGSADTTHYVAFAKVTGLQDSLDAVQTAEALNTTHRTSNGTDHSYIDQDVTSTGTPTFGNITFGEYLYHDGDANTQIRFVDDRDWETSWSIYE